MTTNTLVIAVLSLAVLVVLLYTRRVEGMITGYGYNIAGGAENAQTTAYSGAGLAIMGGSSAAPLVAEPMAGSGVEVPGAPPPPAPAGTCPARCTVYNEAGAVVYTGPCQPEVRLVPAGPPVPAGCPACPACQGTGAVAPGPIVPGPGVPSPMVPGPGVPGVPSPMVPGPGAGVPSVRDWTPSSMAPAPAPGPYSQGPSLMTNGNIEVADMAGHIMWRGTGGTHIKTADWPQTTKFLSDVSQLAPAPGPMAPAPGPMAGVPAPAPMFEAPAPGPMAEAPAPAPMFEAPAPGPMAEAPAPAPAPMFEAPAPGPMAEAPVPGPMTEAPAPAPMFEAPAPGPMFEAPAPGPMAPAPAPGVPAPAPAPGVPAPSPAPGKQIPYVSNVPLAQATKDNFDYEFYRATGPGLAKFTPAQLWNHWVANRNRESRPWRVKLPSPAPGVPSPAPGKQIPYVSNAAIGQATKANFDYEFYRATGPGLAKFTPDQLWNHWMANRTRESRPWRVKPSMLPALLPAGAKSPAPVPGGPAPYTAPSPKGAIPYVSNVPLAQATKANFDYEFYRATGPGLAKFTPDQLWNHWIVNRTRESRPWRVKPAMLALPAVAKPVAQPVAKPVAQPVAKPVAASTVTRNNFDYDYYRANTMPNSPLRKANNDAVWKHFDTVGRKEPGRRWRVKMTAAKTK